MVRRFVLLLLAAMLLGCAQPPAPAPTPENRAVPQPEVPSTGSGAAQPVAQPVTAERNPPPGPGREAVEGGFRLGPFSSVGSVRWLDSHRILGSFRTRPAAGYERGIVSLDEGGIEPLVGNPPPMWDWHQHLSPDGTRVVTFNKASVHSFVDLRTGQEQRLSFPGFYGINVFSEWAPDGQRYLIQSTRQDKVPGFYFLDADGTPSFTFQEDGYFSHWARWSPDSRHVGFLSVPIDLKYPTAPDGWEEQPFGPQVGVLDVANGRARYFPLDQGQVAFARPLWSPDGRRIAITCGDLLIEEVTFGHWSGKITTIRNSRICIIDLAAGTVRPLVEPGAPDEIVEPEAWSPDGEAVLLRVRKDRHSEDWYAVVPTEGGPTVRLPGKALWMNADHIAVTVHDSRPPFARLLLVDRQGSTIRTLAEGTAVSDVALSPDGRHLSFLVSLGRDNSAGAHTTYLAVLKAATD